MNSTPALARNALRYLMLVLVAFLAASILVISAPTPAAAETEDDTVGVTEEEPESLPFTIQGFVRSAGTPIEGAVIAVTGESGFSAETTSAENGAWNIGVPTKDEVWRVSLDESSLPADISVPEDFAFEVEATFGSGSSVTRNFTLGSAERVTATFADQLLSRTVNGLNFGLMLALAAIGLSLVYGTTGLANFAHGEMVTLGAVLALALSALTPIWIAIPLALLGCAIFGWSIDTGIWKPLRRKGLGIVQLMIVSIGISLAVRYIFQIFIGGSTQRLPGGSSSIIPGLGAVRITMTDVFSMGFSLVVIIIFAFWLMRSRLGRATRAVSDNPSLAAASGIDVDRVIRSVWIIASVLAGISGILWAYFRPGLRWDMGTSILLLMFAAVTLGGLGTAFGALVGSIIVGLAVEVSTLWLPSDLKYVGALGALIIILLFRPQGLLGRKERIG